MGFSEADVISALEKVFVTANPRVLVGIGDDAAVVKGDALVPAISAASIVAKVRRDAWCLEVHEQFPQYGFATHKGYPTVEHLEALRRHGPSPVHRRSFAPVRDAVASR